MKIYGIMLKYSECNCYNKYIEKNNEKIQIICQFQIKIFI